MVYLLIIFNMWELILFPTKKDVKNTKENQAFKTEATITECLKETKLIKEDVYRILKNKNELLKLSPEELSKYIKFYILECLIKSKNISSELFLCWEYIWWIIKELVIWKISINAFAIDYMKNEEFKNAADISILKYIFLYSRKRKEFCTQKDFIVLAVNNYYLAYWQKQFNLWYAMSHRLKEIDKCVNLQWIPERMFPKNFRIL